MLLEVINEIYDSGKLPEPWKQSNFITLHKIAKSILPSTHVSWFQNSKVSFELSKTSNPSQDIRYTGWNFAKKRDSKCDVGYLMERPIKNIMICISVLPITNKISTNEHNEVTRRYWS